MVFNYSCQGDIPAPYTEVSNTTQGCYVHCLGSRSVCFSCYNQSCPRAFKLHSKQIFPLTSLYEGFSTCAILFLKHFILYFRSSLFEMRVEFYFQSKIGILWVKNNQTTFKRQDVLWEYISHGELHTQIKLY